MRIRSKELKRARKRAEERHKARLHAKAKTTTRRKA
jgi:hypothetical protein